MLFLLITGIILSAILIGFIYKKIGLIKSIVLGITCYLFSYVLVSGILFFVGFYSIYKALFLTILLLLAFLVPFYLRHQDWPEFTFEYKECGILLLILLIALPVTANKFEFFGMGQDQGVYQTKAIELMNGNYQRIFDFEEIYTLEDTEAQNEYRQKIATLLGYDFVDRSITTLENVDDASSVAGVYHGIPTWASVLALFGEMFGVSNMQQCQTLLMILFLFLVFCCMDNLHIKLWIKILAIILLGFSPQIIWVSKSALSEMFITVIMSSYFMLLTEKEERLRFYSFVPLVVFSFFHITIYTMLPLFVLLYWALYIIYNDKKYLTSCKITLAGYLLGFCFMLYISPMYTVNNYVLPLSSLPMVNRNTFAYLVIVAVIAAFFITCFMPKIKNNKFFEKICTFLYRKRTLILKLIILSLLCIFCVRCIRSNLDFGTVGHITLVSYAVASGVLLLPATIAMILFMKKSSFKDGNMFVVLLVFIYTIMVYSLFLNFRLAYLYYYGRYLVPYIFVIVLAFCYFINRSRKYHLFALCFLGMLLFVTPNKFLMTKQDDTRMSWDVLEDTMDIVSQTSDSAVVISDNNLNMLFLPLKSTGASVYSEWDDLNSQMDYLSKIYKQVYLVTDNIDEKEGYSLTYRNEDVLVEYATAGKHMLSNYPLEQSQQGRNVVSLYEYHQNILTYNIASDAFEGSGFKPIENNSFAWAGSNGVTISVYLEEQDYLVSLKQGNALPLSALELAEYDIRVYVDNQYLTTISIDEENNGKEVEFELPKQYLMNKKAVLQFEYEPWSPMDYGASDNRQLGFCFRELEFQGN